MIFQIKNADGIEIADVLGNYFANIDCEKVIVEKISFGICNETYKVKYDGSRFILQKMSDALSNPKLISDFDFISNSLNVLGWKVPILLKNRKKRNFIKKGRSIWRIYSFIPGMTMAEISNLNYFSVGRILAIFHSNLRDIEYFPIFSIPHFHDTMFFIGKLKKLIEFFENNEINRIAREVVDAFRGDNNLFLKDIQLIHGDPRVENYLFYKNGKAFSIIDFDTFIRGSIFIDIGDLLRSISLTDNQSKLDFSKLRIDAVLKGYMSIYKNKNDKYFIDNALEAMKIMALELCSRFLIDIIEDKYFGWDSKKYKSRKEHNIVRALAQWNVFLKMEK